MKRKLIDVSSHDGRIDWKRVKEHADGAIIRCGYGSDYTSQDDKRFSYNISECRRLGIPCGVYLYSYAKSTGAARSEARHVLRLIKGWRLSYPVYYDLEESGLEQYAKANAEAFGGIIENAGYWCGVYASEHWWKTCLSGLDRFTKWAAKYGTDNGRPQTPPDVRGVDMWQYTSRGKIEGIDGYVDLDECYRDFPAIITGRKSVGEIADEVIDGKWGNGEERKRRLTEAGYDYKEVQAEVNRRLGIN